MNEERRQKKNQNRNKRPQSARALERRRQVRRIELIALAGVLVLLVAWYAITAAGYRSRFLHNTWINGFNVSRMTEAEVEHLLEESVEDYAIELGFKGGYNETVTHEDISLTYVSSGEVGRLLTEQKRFAWLPHKFGKKSIYTVSTSFRFDEGRLRSVLAALPEMQADTVTKPEDARIIRQPNGRFHVRSEIEGNEPDASRILEYVNEAVNGGVRKLNLYLLDGCYRKPSKRADDVELNSYAEELNAFADRTVEIQRKDNQLTRLTRAELTNWVSYDEEADRFYIDPATVYTGCYNLIQSIAAEDNDIHTVTSFKPTRYAEVVIPCPHYGYEIDIGDEADRLNELLTEGDGSTLAIQNAVPETFDNLKDNTYIEVDITNQHVYYYEQGRLRFQTDCVTGLERNVARRTPSGVFSVLSFDRDTTLGSLTSEDPNQRYESFVHYWMPFYGSYGLHDAEWREEGKFGGKIYEEYGSHGCVNLPPKSAETLFTTVERYTPVVVCREGDRAEEGTDRDDLWWNPPEEGLYYAEPSDSETNTEE